MNTHLKAILNTKSKHNKKAIFYVMDALLASMLLIGALLLIYKTYTPEDIDIDQQTFVSQDILNVLSELKLSELNNSFIMQEYTSSNITDMNKSVLDQIGEFWALNKSSNATYLLELVINESIPKNYGLKTSMGNHSWQQELLVQNLTRKINSITSTRMISGIEKNKPLTGSSGASYLKRLRDKKTSSYAYFGGFVGQGNLTRYLELGNVSIIKITIEMDVPIGGTFQLKINNIYCNSSLGVQTFTPSFGNMTSDYWDISSCNASLIMGQNVFTFIFSDMNNAYISGGYIKVEYYTNKFQEYTPLGYEKDYLPGIDGAVNLYDSFYIPGQLNSLDINLHYKVNTSTVQNTFFMTIGDTAILLDNITNGEVWTNLTDSNLSMLNYTSISGSTIPLRIGFTNVTRQTTLSGNGEGFGDIIVTTDLSGSMEREFDSSNTGDSIDDCSDPDLYNPSTSRISVARCVDKIFVDQVLLNTTLNRIGLVSYSDDTLSKLNMTNNQALLEAEINSYTTHMSTCIACGITDAYNLLSVAPPPQLHKDVWRYDLNHQFSAPDPGWYDISYDDSSWSEGNTPFGYNVAGVVTVLSSNSLSANLWEYNNGTHNDVLGPPNDFTSGRINSTGNTYGLNATGNDGWDNKTATYGGNNTAVTIAGISAYGGNNKLRINIDGSGSKQSSDGSYGIQFNVTDGMRAIAANGGHVVVRFEYRWDDASSNKFESDDEIWIKARLTNTSGTSFYLGSQLDGGHSGTDATFEIAAGDNPDNDIFGTFTQDITPNITVAGYYYLDFGCKLSRDAANEEGECYFDNIQISFVDNIGNTYYRNIFSMHNLTRFSDAILYVASDNRTEVYLNGHLIDNDTTNHSRSYWNRNVSVNISNFVEGENILAVKLANNDNTSGFLDLKLRANMTQRQKAILIMSDGDANQCVRDWTGNGDTNYCNDCAGRACCPNGTTGALTVPCADLASIPNSTSDEKAFEQVINISCYLHDKYNISMYSVAFGTEASVYGTRTLNLSAACDNTSHFYTTNNVSAIAEIYQDIATAMVTGFSATESQALVFSGSLFATSTLYPDSYISYNYTPIVTAVPGEIEVVFESPKFTSCNQSIEIPAGVRVIDAKITSYSGSHWTDYMSVNSNTIYNLSRYNNNYSRLGDPFIIQIPATYLNTSGTYMLSLRTGDGPNSTTNCSANNSFIYTALISSTIARSEVLPKISGCNWIVDSENTLNQSHISVPSSPMPTKTCFYTNATMTYTPTSILDDAYDLAVYTIFRQLDVDNDGRIIVSLESEDLEVVVLTVGGLPYMWGPSLMKLEVWQ